MHLQGGFQTHPNPDLILPLPVTQDETTPVRQRRTIPIDLRSSMQNVSESFDGTLPPSEQRRQARAATAAGMRPQFDVSEHSPLRFSEPSHVGVGVGVGLGPSSMGLGAHVDPLDRMSLQPGSPLPLRSSLHASAMGLADVGVGLSRPGTAQPMSQSAAGLHISVDDDHTQHAALATLAMSPTLQPGHLEHVKDSRFLSLFADEHTTPADVDLALPPPRFPLPIDQPPPMPIGALPAAAQPAQPRQPDTGFTDVSKARSVRSSACCCS